MCVCVMHVLCSVVTLQRLCRDEEHLDVLVVVHLGVSQVLPSSLSPLCSPLSPCVSLCLPLSPCVSLCLFLARALESVTSSFITILRACP